MLRLIQLAILVLGLSLIGLASAIVTMHFVIHGAEVKIPNLRGLTAQEALSKAAELGVEMSIDGRYYSAEVPQGRILSQSPAAGTVVRREWHVRLVESLGAQTVAIPKLVGMAQRNAVIELRRLGLDVGAVAHLPYAAPPDTVIAQDPPAGAAGVETPSVALVMGAAATPEVASFVMPDFTGREYATVAATITHAGLKLAPPGEDAPNRNQPPPLPGTVIAQAPQPGYRVDADTPIQLTVVP